VSERTGPGPQAPPQRATARRRWLPFWALQVAELVVALVFVDVSVHVTNGGLLVAAALVLAGLAVTAQGPLGLLRLCSRPLHLVLVMTAAGVAAVAPILPAVRPDIEGIIVLEFGAIGLIRLASFTQSSDTVRAAGTPRRPIGVIDATATVVTPGTPPDPAPTTGRSSGATSQGSAARWVGRIAGAAAASGKRSAARHRPAAEARVRRSIRSAGRIAGRVTSPPANPETPPH
jgi:hypothetical protein